MPYDPNDPYDPHSPMRRQIEEIKHIQQMRDLVDPPGMRAMREAERAGEALRSAYDAVLREERDHAALRQAAERDQAARRYAAEAVEEFKRHHAMIEEASATHSLREALRARERVVVSSMITRDLSGLDALRGVTEQLKATGLLARESEAILRASGIIPGTSATLAALRLDPTLTAVSSAMNDRLRLFGSDALTSATLSTGGIAAQIAQITQANDYARSLMLRQWETFGGMSAAVGRLYALPDIEGRLTSLPGYLGLAPVIEAYDSARSLLLFTPSDIGLEEPLVLDVMAEEVLDELSEELEARLAAVDPHLVASVLGAWDTAQSTNPDRVRQACSSIRSAIEDVIAVIAPRDAAEAWTRTQGFGRKSVVPEGAKDARSAKHWAPQIRFVFRAADSVVGDGSLLSEVAEADLADMLLLLERLSIAVHKGQREVQVEDLISVMRRATAFLSLLLDAHELN
jgi:hypothetical protein